MSTGRRRVLLAAVLAFCLGGCEGMAYYAQAAAGQASLMGQRRPVARLLADPATPASLRARLAAVARIRAFAGSTLGLPVRGQYDSYVVLDRAYPVWAVTATPALSLAPRRWCYWIAGCVSYRGFFSEAAARRLALRLAIAGDDVAVDGVSAYSTLGWFSDPVLSSFAGWSEPELAELLFHELAHQAVYAPGDTDFNESLATVVAEEGLRRYAAASGLDLSRHARERAREAAFVGLALRYRAALAAAYARGPDDEARRQAKAALLAALRRDYAALSADWGEARAGYDYWIASLNNARLAALATYHERVPALRRILRAEGGDMARFLTRCRELARLSAAERHRRLAVSGADAAAS